jgi:hypothetical protein
MVGRAPPPASKRAISPSRWVKLAPNDRRRSSENRLSRQAAEQRTRHGFYHSASRDFRQIG